MPTYGSAQYGKDLYSFAAPQLIRWWFQVDWPRLGYFAGQMEPTPVISMHVTRGRKNSRIKTDGTGQEHPERETFTIVVKDLTGRYDAFNTSSPLYSYLGSSGLLIRIMLGSNAYNTTAQVFTGVITLINYDAYQHQATISGEGMAKWLQIGAAEHVWTPAQDMGNPDPCFVVGSTPFPVNYWGGEYDLTLSKCATFLLKQAGWNFGLFCQNVSEDEPDFFYMDGNSAWEILKGLADALAARILFRGNGQVILLERNDHTGLNAGASPLASPLESAAVTRPSPFECIRNDVQMQVRPHTGLIYQTNNYVVTNPLCAVIGWKNSGPIAISPTGSYVSNPTGTTMQITFQYNGNDLQGSLYYSNTLSAPYTSLAWSANTKPDGSGTDITSSCEFVVLPYTFNGNSNQQTVVAHFFNTTGVTAYFLNLAVYVSGIFQSGNPGFIEAQDALSMGMNGQHILAIDQAWN